jgi:M6 family metalloprotease-like protein
MLLLLIISSAAALPVRAGIVSPRHGGRVPEAFLDRIYGRKAPITFKHAWLNKKRLLTRADTLPTLLPGVNALSGRLNIPVFLGLYSDVPSPPVLADELDAEFFTGPWTPGTMKEYFDEVSYGHLEVTGTVFDWEPLDQNEVFYTGGFANGLDTSYARTGNIIKEIADRLDPSVDFGRFDNDGPDGVPNSGDDDGFVDVLIVVHPTRGAECGGFSNHMWSHSWRYSAWPVSNLEPYPTDDPAAGGETIKIDDYIIGPALSCDEGMIEIGVYCHELGHAIGLPDLYDYTGTSLGIGYWGLMGAGNWSVPDSPAHPCAWSREQLGWVAPREIGWEEEEITINPIEVGGEVLKLVLPTERFRRREYAGPGSGYALICGYTALESANRGWPGEAGYGNEWYESMERDFRAQGSGDLSLRYNITYDTEPSYDFCLLLLESAGGIDTLASYTGSLGVVATIDLGAHIAPGTIDFTLRFLFLSDFNYSDEDGFFETTTGYAAAIDNIRMIGRGIEYACDFETDAGGWMNSSEPAEYFLIANRQRIGFDSYLPGEGLIIWHAENSIAYSYMGNSGGYRNDRARGVVLEEADGRYDLLALDGNFGDSGDPYPGSTRNREFKTDTWPNSRSNGGAATPVAVTDIEQSLNLVSGLFKAGMPPPVITDVRPDTIYRNLGSFFTLVIEGSNFDPGSSCRLSLAGQSVNASTVIWLGENRLLASFGTEQLFSGAWNLGVISPGGQAAETIVQVVSAFDTVSVETGRSFLRLSWIVNDSQGNVQGCNLYRSAGGGSYELLTPQPLYFSDGVYEFKDETVIPDTLYAYRICALLGGDDQECLLLPGPYTISDLPFTVDQNYPNPFSTETTLSFFTPDRRDVAIDIYTVQGARVESFGTKSYDRGTHQIEWAPEPARVSSGVYFCVFRSLGREYAVKLVVIR